MRLFGSLRNGIIVVALSVRAKQRLPREFLLRLITAVPYKIHTVLTDNGIQFTTPGAGGSAVPLIKEAIANGEIFRAHAFEYTCAKNDIEHRTTKPKHPWTNGQVERMNRTIKDATVKRYYYESHDQLRQHLTDFVAAYNFGRRLKTLKGLTPYEFICKQWTKEPERFRLDPTHQMPELNISRRSSRATSDPICKRGMGWRWNAMSQVPNLLITGFAGHYAYTTLPLTPSAIAVILSTSACPISMKACASFDQ